MYFGDVNTAFLHAPVVQETLVKPPAGFISSDGPFVIWKLKKALYGLKSAPKPWQVHLTGQLTEIGLQQLKTGPCLFKHTSEDMLIMVYVDDMFISGRSEEGVVSVTNTIKERMLLRDAGWLTAGTSISYLGRERSRIAETPSPFGTGWSTLKA